MNIVTEKIQYASARDSIAVAFCKIIMIQYHQDIVLYDLDLLDAIKSSYQRPVNYDGTDRYVFCLQEQNSMVI